MTTLADIARGAESRAVDHKAHGRLSMAYNEYKAAAAAWREVAGALSANGETILASVFENEARKNDERARVVLNHIICA